MAHATIIVALLQKGVAKLAVDVGNHLGAGPLELGYFKGWLKEASAEEHLEMGCQWSCP